MTSSLGTSISTITLGRVKSLGDARTTKCAADTNAVRRQAAMAAAVVVAGGAVGTEVVAASASGLCSFFFCSPFAVVLWFIECATTETRTRTSRVDRQIMLRLPTPLTRVFFSSSLNDHKPETVPTFCLSSLSGSLSASPPLLRFPDLYETIKLFWANVLYNLKSLSVIVQLNCPLESQQTRIS